MSKKTIKTAMTVTVSLVIGAVAGMALNTGDTARVINERKAEVMGAAADRYIASKSVIDPNVKVKTVAGLHHISIEVDQFQGNIYRASGVANTFLVNTPAGNVLFDTGLGTQTAKQKRLLQEAVGGDLKYIVLSHSHADHMSGTKFWQAEFPEAKVITHERFADGQRYLKELEPYFWSRNRLLYPFMPENPPEEGSFVTYGGIVADAVVRDGDEYRFELGGTEFVLIPTPGAEGEDNLVMWLPGQKALFTGDVFGPLFPMVPNLFTLRGEKFRDPVAYIQSLDTMIDLNPDMILPSHFDPVTGAEQLRNDMTAMREATRYIHDETVAGMNAGKTMWELMEEIQLPPELALSQGHGKVSWNVRSIWEHYSTWFRFESTTELYPVPVNTLYKEVAEMAGGSEPFIARAINKVADNKPVEALHLIEMALAETPDNAQAYETRLDALEILLAEAYGNGSNHSETGWLKGRITATKSKLASL
ncbi:MAG: MBL fold metallo-hydrolase [Endozoicomonas sp.]